jgi:hypothetical protein
LNTRVSELTSNQTLGVEDSVDSVHGSLRLGSISDKTLSLREGNVRWGGTITLVIGDDLNAIILPDTDTGIGGSKIDSDRFSGNSWNEASECEQIVLRVIIHRIRIQGPQKGRLQPL